MLEALKRIVAWTGPMKRRLIWGCVCSFFMTWAGACPVFIAAWMLGLVADSAKSGIPLDPMVPWEVLAAIAVSIVLRFIFSYGKNRLQESIGYEVAAQDRIEIGERLKHVPLGYFSKVKTGDILATATTELGVLELQGMKMVDAVINGYISVFAIVCFLAFMSPLAALISLVGVGLSALALWGINRKSARLTPKAHEATERLAGAIVEYMRGLATAKSYGRENTAMEPMAEAIDDLSAKRIDIEYGFTPLNVAHLSAIKLTSVGVVAVAAFAALAGQMELWVFIVLALFSFTIFAGVENVNDSAHMLGDLNDILGKLEKLKAAPVIDENGQEVALTHTDIEFDHVDFSYEKDGKQILRDVSFSIPEGTTCALVARAARERPPSRTSWRASTMWMAGASASVAAMCVSLRATAFLRTSPWFSRTSTSSMTRWQRTLDSGVLVPPGKRSRRPQGARAATTSSWSCRKGLTRASAKEARHCREARSSGSPLRVPF